ncbi:unnamed protein product [Cylicocyclus nassatus]|uniref:Uncharacterized protein n=1 Tax=Cylicocyclus nassatus TaxID=53992 RepID=A0AA36DT65_CYLNA|nr:unnamed protein product [Cylicocyclus nassatus]
MRIFNLTFLLLTILVILSAVDVGECGFLNRLFKGIPTKKRHFKIGNPIIKPVKCYAPPSFRCSIDGCHMTD